MVFVSKINILNNTTNITILKLNASVCYSHALIVYFGTILFYWQLKGVNLQIITLQTLFIFSLK